MYVHKYMYDCMYVGICINICMCVGMYVRICSKYIYIYECD